MPNMIFHIPNAIDGSVSSGSTMRPIQMMRAFEEIGYNVDVVMGTGRERKELIVGIKKAIAAGKKYDFLYSESSTMPTLLTEKSHFPVYPFLDFGFFRYCKNLGIHIALFYRDMHWRFSQYKLKVPFLKRVMSSLFYYYDLFQYKRLVDTMYFPHVKMSNYLPCKIQVSIMELPPGIDDSKRVRDGSATCTGYSYIYVGGLGLLYNIKLFADTVAKDDGLTLTLCTRKREWERFKNLYTATSNISVVHQGGNEQLALLYDKADIAVLYLKPTEYWKFAMPLKLFEYMSFRKPILSISGTAVGDFVEKHNIGWVIGYSETELVEFLQRIKGNTDEINAKVANINKILEYHTWRARAGQVASDIAAIKSKAAELK